jgi:Calcineurin-like phosphoesterase
MKRVWGIALMVGVGLLLAGESQAKTTPHRVKCRAGYVRRTVWVPERRHGRIVRTYGLIVYTRVQRCVKVKKPKAPSSPVGVGTATWPTLTPPFTPIGSTPPFSPPPPPPPPPGAPANTAPPTVSGTATESNTLSASTGTWTNGPTSYGYQWQRCNTNGGSCSPTAVATSSYPLTNADVGSTIRVSVTAGNSAGSASATSAATATVQPSTSPGDPVVVAVGDIARPPGCSPCEQTATAALAETFNPNAVLVLGDNQYNSGLYSEYATEYALSWGRDFNSIVHPVPGNHEYITSGAAGYFQYFGQATANPDHNTYGYYSLNIGTWHIVALNSNCSDSGCADALTGGTTSAQTAWLQNDLATNTQPCVLAMWHHPLFSYGWTLGAPSVLPLWTALYNAHADVVLNGHDHLYERFTQMNPSGGADSTGIREFVVGTGGESLNGLYGSQPPATLQAHDSSDYGVLVLTLHASSYSWSFVNTGGHTIDSGTTACNSKGTGASAALAREAKAPSAVALSGPPLVFNARPVRSSLTATIRRGLPVAVQLSRAADVTVTVSVRWGTYLQRIASFYETESQISKPYSEIFLHLPARRLAGLGGATLVLKFVAVDSAAHRRVVTTKVSLGNG